MRKRYRVLIFAALVAALIAPVGLALSVPTVPAGALSAHPVAVPFATAAVTVPAVTVPVALLVGSAASGFLPQEGFDAAGLLMVGTVLFGLAAVIRKAI
jgi:hypothetical protein